MRHHLIEGYLIETDLFHLQGIKDLLETNGIDYNIHNYSDPREKYKYYKRCNYPYSPMNHLNYNED